MNKAFFAKLFIVIANLILAPFVLMSLWNWFIFPITKFYIGYLQSMGIQIFVGFFLFSLRSQVYEIYNNVVNNNYIYSSSAFLLFAYISGAIVNYFMVV